jgi:hypothetical protein
MYAQISNTGTVLMVEDCYRNGKQYPLEELYHKDILPLFTEVPDGIYPQIGWKYDGKIFTEPQLLEYIPELNLYYNPYPQDEALARLALESTQTQTSLALELIALGQEQTTLLLSQK